MVRYFITLMCCFAGSNVQAAIPPLYQDIATHHHMPASVLYALALGESKTKLQSGAVRPWPWTLNVKGKPYFYPSFDAACQALQGFLTHTQMVDIGLTQHNWRWQKSHFKAPCDVFDPHLNLNHAARLLNEGKRKHGSWVKAAGYFHRPATRSATANPALTPLVIALTLACQDKTQRPEAALMQLIATAKHQEENVNEHQQ